MNQLVETEHSTGSDIIAGESLDDFVTFYIKDQMFGIPVLKVQDILQPETIASIPLAPAEVKGSINLRGRIVTVIDVRVRLGLDKRAKNDHSMAVTVEHDADLYTLLVDKVGDVIGLSKKTYEDNPSTLDPLWRDFALGVYRLEGQLMVVLDVDRLLDIRS
ncbi:MAG: chemotaxis protein CheW [Rhodospirillales bacterium]|nr:chemotaxis protein CheW [Rhodospirillales bacterium]